jgi:hypothetical protein
MGLDTMRRFALALLGGVLATAAGAQDPEPIDAAALVGKHSRALAYADRNLTGAGADFLERATADSQFVLLGESHYRREVPLFAGALFRMLRSKHGYHHLAVEQDQLAIEEALKPSDQDLEFLADVGTLEPGSTAICGLEQATGPVRYLDELASLAPDADTKAVVDRAQARALRLDPEPKYTVNFLADAATPAELDGLRARFADKAGARATELLLALAKSSEIFGYYRRAEAGEPVGLFNNTVREEWIKRQFIACHRIALASEPLPKVLFKFGNNHMYRGKNPTQAYPIGNFAHEFAIWNGMRAYGIDVVSLPAQSPYEDIPAWQRLLLPAQPPARAIVIDLQAMRPLQRLLRQQVSVEDQWMFRDYINGFDAIVVLPGDRDADMKLSGLKPPG